MDALVVPAFESNLGQRFFNLFTRVNLSSPDSNLSDRRTLDVSLPGVPMRSSIGENELLSKSNMRI